jgi:hypothetical protein
LSRTRSNFSTSVNDKSPTKPTAATHSADDGRLIEHGGVGNGCTTTNGFVLHSPTSDSAGIDLQQQSQQPQSAVKVTLDVIDRERAIDVAIEGQVELEKRSTMTPNVTSTSPACRQVTLAAKPERHSSDGLTPQVAVIEGSVIPLSCSFDTNLSRCTTDGLQETQDNSASSTAAEPAESFEFVLTPSHSPLTCAVSDSNRCFGISQSSDTTTASALNNRSLSLPPSYDVACR